MEQTSQAPPVDISPMPHLPDDLGSEVLRRAADGIGGLFVLKDLGKSKVGELDVAHAVNDDVFWLETR
jgi:hypothetical protein